MKKFISIISAIIFIIIPLTVGASAEAGVIPRISIRGFMNASIYDGNGNTLWPVTTEEILKNVAALAPEMAKLAVSDDWEKFGDATIKAVNNIFGDLKCDKNGIPLNDSGPHFKYPTSEEIEKNPVIDYCIDWRIDPFESASDLNDFVQYLDKLGYDKVVFDTHSYANTVLITYLTVYGTENVKSVCFCSSAYYGASFAGWLVTGGINADGEGLVEYLRSILDSNSFNAVFDLLFDIIEKSGLNFTVTDFINKLFEKQGEKIYKEFAVPIFGCWPSVWAMTADEDIEAGMKYVFDTLLVNEKADYSELIGKINKYNSTMRVDRAGKLKKINEGCSVYVFSNYGYANLPLSDEWNKLSDSVVDTKYTSFGATCKNYNSSEKFSAGKYVSPNGLIDASTALFKDQTWFFRNAKHKCITDEGLNMLNSLLYYDGQATIECFEEYPQFMMYDSSENTIKADNYSNRDGGFFTLIKYLFDKILNYFKNIFAEVG